MTLLINGMPLAFIEVKKPNNREGIQAERELLRLSIAQLNKAHDFQFPVSELKAINKLIFKEYLDESNGRMPA